MTKLNSIAVALASVGILAAGAGLLAQQPGGVAAGLRGGEPDRPATKDHAPVEPAIKALIEGRLRTAREVFEEEMGRYEHTLTLFSDDTSVWSRRWMEEQLRLSPKPAERLVAIQDHLKRVKRLEIVAQQYAKTGQGRISDALKAKYFRLEAEELLAEAKASHPNVPLQTPKAIEGNREPVRLPTPRK
jgi:hypothetical protein